LSASGSLLPAWLPGYSPATLRADAVAGLTLAAYLIPAGIGDASLANLPPEAGLYACLFSGLVFWLFCSARHTAITVTSAISLLIGSSLGTLAGGDPVRFAALAAGTALLVAAMAFAAYALKAGTLVNFVSETVMVGFKSGVALFLASTQLPKLFGFKASHGNFWERSHHFLTHLAETNVLSVALGAGAFVMLLLGRKFLPGKPVALLVVVAGIVLSTVFDLGDLGVKLLGEVPQGLPDFGMPAVSLSDVNELLPIALACFMLAAVETAAIGRMFAQKHGYRLDSNRDLLGLATSNLATAVGQGYPVSGGMSQSLVNESGGARTPLSGLFSALFTLLVVLFLTGLLRDLPQPVLAAIVLFAVTSLFKLEALKRLWRFSRGEFLVAAAALAGVLGTGLLRGVLVGALLSVLLLMRRASTPHAVELGRVPGTSDYGDIERDPQNERDDGVLVFRVDSSLLYMNVDHVRDTLEATLRARRDQIRLVVFHLGTVPLVDLAGADLLEELRERFEQRGIAFRLAEARGNVREALCRSGYGAGASVEVYAGHIAAIIEDWRAAGVASPQGPPR
jgi:high affinity sulfate transporter 1